MTVSTTRRTFRSSGRSPCDGGSRRVGDLRSRPRRWKSPRSCTNRSLSETRFARWRQRRWWGQNLLPSLRVRIHPAAGRVLQMLIGVHYPALRRVRVRCRRPRVCMGNAAARQYRSRKGPSDHLFHLHGSNTFLRWTFILRAISVRRKFSTAAAASRGISGSTPRGPPSPFGMVWSTSQPVADRSQPGKRQVRSR